MLDLIIKKDSMISLSLLQQMEYSIFIQNKNVYFLLIIRLIKYFYLPAILYRNIYSSIFTPLALSFVLNKSIVSNGII